MILNKKQIRVIVLFKFKMGLKQRRQFVTSTKQLARELLTNLQCSGVPSFAKKRALKTRHAWSWQWPIERIMEADPLTTTWEVAKELNTNHCLVIGHLKQIGRWKRLVSGCLKNHHFEALSSVILHNNNEPFLDWIVTCDEKKWTVCDHCWWPTLAGPRSSSHAHFLKPNLHHKGHDHCSAVCCPSDPLELSESWQSQCTWEVQM